MEKRKKYRFSTRRICILVVLLLILLAALNFNTERRIQRFVLKYEVPLTDLAEAYLKCSSSEREKMRESAEADFHGAQLAGLFPESVVTFYMGGFGLVPSAKYYGFYYSPEDIPVSTGEGELKPQEEKENRWSWDGYGDNGGEIVKIKEHWYYYKCWF